MGYCHFCKGMFLSLDIQLFLVENIPQQNGSGSLICEWIFTIKVAYDRRDPDLTPGTLKFYLNIDFVCVIRLFPWGTEGLLCLNFLCLIICVFIYVFICLFDCNVFTHSH